jgi:hypothetical protein
VEGVCKWCGFAGTNDEMESHAGEMCWENLPETKDKKLIDSTSDDKIDPCCE